MLKIRKQSAIGLFCVILSLSGEYINKALAAASPPAPQLILVEGGQALAPIVIFKDAPPLTRRAADELAYYIEKTSGARPEIVEGLPDPLPESAIWVGYQPVLNEIFPEIDFDFKYPEEMLIAANDKHLVIAGRDRWDPDHMLVKFSRITVDGVQREYGTHNAVYTFLQDYLGVRWLWPGELGEDILKQDTIAFKPFQYRYHPQVRARSGLFPWMQLHGGLRGPEDEVMVQGGALGHYWARAQRLQLCEFPSFGGGGGWGRWRERFYETHPEYFALQPDGTRAGGDTPFPNVHNVKMCMSNPDLWQQWLADVEEKLQQNPTERVFNVA
ncbi:MAG: DUF4838 domain-containing protein, partial [Kiritimatiellia bacterium]|nr:hypothetical protein [Lentisphaerota bacterium]